ncbi:hypothetical protein N2152v2_010645 [Parachlorella kessleri]
MAQQQRDLISSAPLWTKLLGAAAAFAAWYSIASFCKAATPFLSLSLALGTSSEADHLAALTPLTIGRSHFKASLMGALWGFGHSTGQLILGLLMVILKDKFTQLVPALSKWGGATVGLTLLAIGCLGIYESFFDEHHDEEHSAVPAEAAAEVLMQDGVLVARPKAVSTKGFGTLATFATGIVYGLQPDALFVIVPALALPTKVAATAYIFCFVAGTVCAMGGYSAVISATSAALKKSNSGLTQKLSGIASAAAIAIGITILAGGLGVSLPFGLGVH